MSVTEGVPITQYQYYPLQDDEIRLLHLQPGSFDDLIRFNIVHEPLVVPNERDGAQVLAQRQIQTSLPKHWRVFKTPEGRWFYARPDGPISYDHPHPDRLPEGLSTTSKSEASQEPKFEALSYVWGDLERTKLAHVKDNDANDTGSLRITANLDCALRHLRDKSIVRTLWVDAVCINQENLQERAAQVLRMRDIYRLADRVVVWLGPASHHSSLALHTLEYLGKQFEIADDVWCFEAIDARESWWDKQIPLPYGENEWSALQQLFARPWFQRLWVIQEIAVANHTATIQCGQDSISWYHLRRAIAAFQERSGVPSELSYVLNNKADVAHGLENATLWEMIFISRQHRCSDSRDKIYGVMAFIPKSLRNEILPSYERPYEDLFKEIFLKHCRVTSRLDLLTQCILQERSFVAPSWVPDWRGYPSAFRTSEPGFQASGLSPADSELASNDVLEVMGVLVGGIISTVFDGTEADPESLASKLRELKPKDLLTGFYVTGESMLDAWTRTLLIDHSADRFPDSTLTTLKEWQDLVLPIVTASHASAAWNTFKNFLGASQYSPSQDLAGINNNIRDTLTDMSFFRTSKGYFGFAPVGTEEGDLIYVLLGLHTPLVIRPTNNGYFEVVGWCYTHGLMGGETFLGPLPKGCELQYRWVNRRYVATYHAPDGRKWLPGDPRLPALPSEWQREEHEITAEDPICVAYFRNSKTGELINHDPRMSAKELEKRGVKLQKLRLP